MLESKDGILWWALRVRAEGAQWARHDQWRCGLDVVWSAQRVKKDRLSIGIERLRCERDT